MNASFESELNFLSFNETEICAYEFEVQLLCLNLEADLEAEQSVDD